jgi:uncharacterized protein YukE
MGGGFAHEGDALRAHADTVSQLKAKVDQAVDAAHQVTPGGWDNAYGLICQFIPIALRPVANLGIEAMQKTSDTLGKTATELKATADFYDHTEQQTKQSMDKIQQQLGSAAKPPMRSA